MLKPVTFLLYVYPDGIDVLDYDHTKKVPPVGKVLILFDENDDRRKYRVTKIGATIENLYDVEESRIEGMPDRDFEVPVYLEQVRKIFSRKCGDSQRNER